MEQGYILTDMKKLFIGVILILISGHVFSQRTTMLIDERDGNSYNTVCINGVVWMAENLAFKPEKGNFWAYDNDYNNVKRFGFLYDWDIAQNVCPDGWHLPSVFEFKQLAEVKPHNFNILLGGYEYGDDSFTQIRVKGYWWSSTMHSDGGSYLWYCFMDSDYIVDYSLGVANGYSVRCIKD